MLECTLACQKNQNQKMTKKMYCTVIIFVKDGILFYCLYMMSSICVMQAFLPMHNLAFSWLLESTYLFGDRCKLWNLSMEQFLDSTILLKIVVSCLLIVHNFP